MRHDVASPRVGYRRSVGYRLLCCSTSLTRSEARWWQMVPTNSQQVVVSDSTMLLAWSSVSRTPRSSCTGRDLVMRALQIE